MKKHTCLVLYDELITFGTIQEVIEDIGLKESWWWGSRTALTDFFLKQHPYTVELYITCTAKQYKEILRLFKIRRIKYMDLDPYYKKSQQT